jgi:uridine kinase
MHVGPGETAVEQWGVFRIDTVLERLLGAKLSRTDSPRFLAVDGRSGGGKSTLAAQLQRHLAKSTIVHTDDVAWHHSYFDWSDLLIDGVLRPVQAYRKVDYRPPAWERRGRPGSIIVDEECAFVIIEGVGASRQEIRPWLTASVWIQSDMDEAERRGIARDGGTEEARSFWMDWMREENAFLERQQPWVYATAIVNGTPWIAYDPEREVVVAL